MRHLFLVGMVGMLLACGSGPDVRVRGIVRHPDGGAAGGTLVTIDRGAGPVHTGDDGRYEFDLSLEDAIYSDPEEYEAPLHVIVGDYGALYSEAWFTVDRSGTVELPAISEWEGAFTTFDGGISTPRPYLADLVSSYAIRLNLRAPLNEFPWFADYEFGASTHQPVLPMDPDVFEDRTVSVELSAQALVGQTSLTLNAAPFTLSGSRIPLSRGAPCDLGQSPGLDAGTCPYTDGHFQNELTYSFVPYVAIQLPSPVVVTKAIVHDLRGASGCMETLDAAAGASFTNPATFSAIQGGNDVIVPLASTGPVSIVRLRCVQPDGGTEPLALTELSIF